MLLGKTLLVMLGPVAFHVFEVQQLLTARGQLRQLPLLIGVRRRDCGLEGRAIIGKHGGIEGIGFGAQSLGFGKVAHAGRFDEADGHGRGVEHA